MGPGEPRVSPPSLATLTVLEAVHVNGQVEMPGTNGQKVDLGFGVENRASSNRKTRLGERHPYLCASKLSSSNKLCRQPADWDQHDHMNPVVTAGGISPVVIADH